MFKGQFLSIIWNMKNMKNMRNMKNMKNLKNIKNMLYKSENYETWNMKHEIWNMEFGMWKILNIKYEKY